MRKIGSRLIHVADLKMATSRLSTSVLDPRYHMKHQNDLSIDGIAVVGMSCAVPGADNLEEFWKLLCDGKSQHVEVPGDRFGFDTAWREIDSQRKWYGNFIKDYLAFDHKFFKKTPREVASMDPQQRLMLQIAYQAIEQSGYFCSPKHKEDKHIGCFIGVSNVDYENNIACYPANAFSATGTLKSFVAGKISHYFGWTGPGLTIDTACSASAVAVHQACKAILSGDCRSALAGGVNLMTSPLWFQNLAGASFLSPTGPCKSFDAKADGYCRGEGSGAVFLKKVSSAIADGNQILGVIASTAVYQNQNCTAITVPNAESLSELFRNVIRQAHLEPEHISVVEAHGTGTPVGDPAEYESVRRVFGGSIRSNKLSLGSVKGLVGHAECASGIVSLIKTLLMIQEGFLPPQASFDTINPSLKASQSDKIEILTSIKPWDVDFRAAIINNYGASGSNASMVVTQAPRHDLGPVRNSLMHTSGTVHPFWFCGHDEQSLRVYSARLLQFLQSKQSANLSIPNIAFNVSRQSNRSLGHALIFSCSSIDEMKEKLTAFEGDRSVSSIARQCPRPVVLCFGGQVSTYIGLNRQIYESVMILRSHLDKCNTICQFIGLASIYPEIFQTTPVDDPVKLQTMLFAIQYSCAKSWIDCGIQVAALVGHSFGELTALCISGVLSLKDAVKLIAGRARLIRDSWGVDKGAMMAVEANIEDVEKLLTKTSEACQRHGETTIACFNGPRSFTLAGPSKSVEALAEAAVTSAASSSIKTKQLNVTNAFHSTLVDPLMVDLEQMAKALTFREPAIPHERATEFESTDRLTPRYVAQHMRYPVYFHHAVQRLSKRYPSCIWLEAGSNSTITKMASRGLGPSSASHFQSINITSDNALHNLTEATTNLWKQGLSVVFWPHHSLQTSEYALLLLPPYQFEKSRHFMELKNARAMGESGAQSRIQEKLANDLWTFVEYGDDKRCSARFQVNTTTEKFEQYVSGHRVAHAAPICPSTLQLDIVIEALTSLLPNSAASCNQPQLQGLENHAPLCMDASRLVWLNVETSDVNSYVWNWKMISNNAQGRSGTILHVSGKIAFRSLEDAHLQGDFAKYERLVRHQRCLDLLDSSNADDVIKGRSIYKAFADVVDYGEMYRGVQIVVGKDNESAGRVVKTYTGETWLDTSLCDSFCQVAGIFVNCMTDRSDKEVSISNKIEQLIRSPKSQADDYSPPEVWDVFACHHRPSDKVFVSDVFVFDPRDGSLLGVILGIHYQRVSKAALGKALSRLTPMGNKSEPAASAALVAMEEPQAATPSPVLAPHPHAPNEKLSRSPDIADKVRRLLVNISGLEAGEIKDHIELADIGVDSLMGMELAREIETVFGCSLDTSELVLLTDFRSLVTYIQSALGSIDNDAPAAEEELAAENEQRERQSAAVLSEESTAAPSAAKLSTQEILVERLSVTKSYLAPNAQRLVPGFETGLPAGLEAHVGVSNGVGLAEGFEIGSVDEPDVLGAKQARSASEASSTPVPPLAAKEAPQVNGVFLSAKKDNPNVPTAPILGEYGDPKKQSQKADCAARQAAVDDYVRKYTQGFSAPVRPNKVNQLKPRKQCVLLTGATGSLGSHIAEHFAGLSNVQTVICLNRRSSMEPFHRQRRAMESRGLSLDANVLSKLKVFETDTAKSMLGLPSIVYEDMINTVTHIVHNAWPMSIKRPVDSFGSQFQVMQNLIELACKISRKRTQESKVAYQFVSSIATVGLYGYSLLSDKNCVPENRMTVDSALQSGYADAKLVCEKMLDETLGRHPDQFRPMVVRIGQIAGSKSSGYWSPTEHLSHLVKSSETLKALPDLEGVRSHHSLCRESLHFTNRLIEQELSWCPVNDVAAILGDLLLSNTDPYPIYHVENPQRQPWGEMIAVLADALGIPRANIIPFQDWLNRVRHFSGSVEANNPARNVIDFFDEHFIRMACGGLILDTSNTSEHSKALASVGPVSADLVRKYVLAWKQVGLLHT